MKEYCPLTKEDCLLLTDDDGVPVNIRRVGDEDVSSSSARYQCIFRL